MTGEITLRGRVFAIGGLKEKLLAAKQHAIKTVLVPKENSDDLAEVLKETNDLGLNIVFVESMDEVLKYALEKDPFVPNTTKSRKKAKSKTVKKKKSTSS